MTTKRKLLQDLLGDYIYPYTDAGAVQFDKTIKNILAAQEVQAAIDELTTATMGIVEDVAGLLPDARRVFVEYDFPYGATGFPGVSAAISTGTATTLAAGDVDHVGCVTPKSSTTANSGYYFALMGITAMRLNGGEIIEAIFKTPAAHTGNTIRFGFHDSITSAAPVDGIFMEMVAGVVTAKTRNNSVETADATTYTLAVSTWYRLRVKYLGAGGAKFEIMNATGTVLWTRTITTNIPTTSGREVGAILVGTNSGTTAVELFTLDYMNLRIDRMLNR